MITLGLIHYNNKQCSKYQKQYWYWPMIYGIGILSIGYIILVILEMSAILTYGILCIEYLKIWYDFLWYILVLADI